GELVHRLERMDQVAHALHSDLHALHHVGGDAALLQDALDVTEADHEIAQVVDDARGELAHGSQALEVQEMRLRAADLNQARVQRGRFRDLQRFVSGLRLVDAVPGFEEISQDCEVGFLIVYDENPATAGLPNAV